MKGILAIMMILSALVSHAQTSGDYRSKATGNWGDTTVWERFDGTGWQAASHSPSSTDGVIDIQATHVITVATFITADQIVVDAGGTLSVTATLSLLNASGDEITCNGIFALSGTVSGSGATCSVSGVMNWLGGICGVPLTVRPEGTLNLTSALLKTLNATLTNAGTINWNAGSFTPGSSTLSNTGTFNVAVNATLSSSGTAGTLNNSGSFNLLPGNTFANNINFNNSGTISIPAGAAFTNTRMLVLNTGTIISGTGSFNWIGQESIKIAVDIPASIALNISAGAVTGDSPLNIPGVLNWSGGTIGSQVFLAATATLNLSGSHTILSGNIISSGMIKWTAGAFDLDGGTLTNYGIFQTDFDGIMSIPTYSNGYFNNFGSFRKTGGSGTSTLGVFCTNTGQVDIDSGTLMNTRGIIHSGLITIPSGTKFINAGSFTFNNAGAVDGSGGLESRDLIVVNNYLNIPASITFTNSGRILAEGRTLTVNGTMYWTGGSLQNATFTSGAVINISGSQTRYMDGRTYNDGIINWSEGNIYAGGLFYNRGVMNITAEAKIYSGSQVDSMTNSGTINKLQGSNTTIVGNFTNTGTININSGGTVTLSGDVFNTGTITIPAKATMETTGNIYFNNGTVLTGSGNIVFRGDETINTPLNLSASLTLSKAGGITLGKSLITINGVMYWTAENLQSPINIAKGAIMVITGPVNKFLGDTLRNFGSIYWLQGNIETYRAPIYNYGVFSCPATSLAQMPTLDTVSFFTNSGVFVKDSASSYVGMGMRFLNTGLVSGKGSIYFYNEFTNRGTVETGPSAGKLDLFPSKFIRFDSAGSLNIKIFNNSGAGTGNDLVNALDIALAGNLTVTETGTPPAGTYTILSSYGSITGTFSSLSLPPGYTISYTPNSVLVIKQSILPLTLLTFKAMEEGSAVSLTWNTSTEYNTDRFVVERSNDGTGFVQIGFVASKGDSLHSTGYTFVDRQPARGLNYYRLKMLDKGGLFTYSPVVTVNPGAGNVRPAVYPNPVRTHLTVEGLIGGQSQTIRLVDQAGHTVYNKITSANKLDIDISRQPSGIYWLVIFSEGRLKVTSKIIKE